MNSLQKYASVPLLVFALVAPQPFAAATEYYVSLSGKDTNPGTDATQPFRTITKGVSVLQAGDILNLRHGVYVELVDIAGKQGAETNPIVIRSYPGEHAYIDGSLPEFRKKNNADWEPAILYDPNAHRDEYVSVATFSEEFVNRGAFLDRNPYTRLITYSTVEDLRADNQTFDKIGFSDPRPGPSVLDKCKADELDDACAIYDAEGNRYKPLGYRHPWVYMGPGIWFNKATGRVHIRLSRTTNNIDELADYDGAVDPRQVQLAIAPKAVTTLVVRGSRNLRIENLSVRYGGDYTVLLQKNTRVVFDHVRIFASSYGVRMGSSNDTVFAHCQFDGGTPTWYFRSDRKSEYYYIGAGGADLNNMGKQTSRALLLGSSVDSGTEIANCEFRNAHDLYLVGKNLRFHHNWINNLNDEGLVLDSGDNDNVHVFQNVITKTLSPISFAGAQVGGLRYIYRNLVDVRAPTAGHRPRFQGDIEVWRYGNTFKSNDEDGPYDLFHNTFLVYAQEEQASYLHYRNLRGNHRRRTFNNIFVAVNPDSGSDRPITFLPPPCFPGPTDGNDYFRMGAHTKPVFRYLEYSCSGVNARAGTFANLKELHDSNFFLQTMSQYAPGYEAQSKESDPQFRRIGSDGIPTISDDLRLGEGSPASAGGVILPDELQAIDPLRAGGLPDIGAYPFGSAPLKVGVDGRKSFPQTDGGQ